MTNARIQHLDARVRCEASSDAAPVLSVQHLSGEGFYDVSFSLRAGEIVGLAGVVGAGRTELAETIVGIRPAMHGRVTLNGAELNKPTPRTAADRGLVYLPEDRQQNGLFLEAALFWNVSAAMMHHLPLFPPRALELAASETFIRTLGIKTRGAVHAVGRLSGGNQQKVLIAKCLAPKPRILIVDEPTRGVDVSARADIYEILLRLADEGAAVLVISSDFDEIEHLARSVLVMTRGSISGALTGDDVSVREIARLAFSAAEP